MKRGDMVLVRAFPDEILERVVWEEQKTYVILCRREIYERAIEECSEPTTTMGFPKGDIIQSVSADA